MTLNEYINSIKDKKIAVIGMGVSNMPLIKLLLISGCSVTVCDKRSLSELGADAFSLISSGAVLRLGEDYLKDLNFDIIFRTPGLMPFDPALKAAAAAGATITSEMEVFFAVCPCHIIAITGSDGKTTTSTITSLLLEKQGYKVHLGGNIGKPLLCDVPYFKSDDYAVLELSSFQLHSMHCEPERALITNITPNHLDKHKDYADYIQAKTNIFTAQSESDLLVLNIDDPHYDELKSIAKSTVKSFSLVKPVESGVFYADGAIWRSRDGIKTKVIDTEKIVIPGRHNIANYMAAFALTEGLVSDENCRAVAETFTGVEHRLEKVAEINGITFINDSIASSPTRTIAGLKAVKTKPILILGGYDKHIPFDVLGDAVNEYAKRVYLCGATADKIREAIINSKAYDGKVCIETLDDFKETVLTAYNNAESGDLILLSPACAAFDKFKNFAERGKYFKQIVMELVNGN